MTAAESKGLEEGNRSNANFSSVGKCSEKGFGRMSTRVRSQSPPSPKADRSGPKRNTLSNLRIGDPHGACD
jgi:hypothetical protein